MVTQECGFFCNIILNIKAARMQAGDVEYACHCKTLLKQTSIRAKKTGKNFARFSLASELNVLTITSLLIM